MRTDKPTTTASARPEKVRTYNDADREAIARGNATAMRINAQAQADKMREEWRHPITGETRSEMHAKRTKCTPQVKALDGMTPLGIPAEKPTDGLPEINWVAIAESHVEATKRAEAQAAQLAEALRECITEQGAMSERSHYNAKRRLQYITDTARLALAAYEDAQ
jgi:hypothetical protein